MKISKFDCNVLCAALVAFSLAPASDFSGADPIRMNRCQAVAHNLVPLLRSKVPQLDGQQAQTLLIACEYQLQFRGLTGAEYRTLRHYQQLLRRQLHIQR